MPARIEVLQYPASQSPCGAKWFATCWRPFLRGFTLTPWGRNPLAGLSGLQPATSESRFTLTPGSQSPCGAKWFATVHVEDTYVADNGPQSPCGAKWFATVLGRCWSTPLAWGRNPLAGLSGLQLYPSKNALLDGTAKGGFVRKMKFGICMGRITGVFGGLCR
jgi:hypothetical protein